MIRGEVIYRRIAQWLFIGQVVYIYIECILFTDVLHSVYYLVYTECYTRTAQGRYIQTLCVVYIKCILFSTHQIMIHGGVIYRCIAQCILHSIH